ncbi:hypothetical protein [Paenibacillus tarimensis]|uniref:hypothetical protein n=1 Tax=Paenibacillus tarimensis TaxID=416012 RepID=UPI001F2B079F|nr:hypothetical protein [Paenibacillus tarimensis]MCF2945872.1 hypothetical protein [Paenibacillus tarimensis]
MGRMLAIIFFILMVAVIVLELFLNLLGALAYVIAIALLVLGIVAFFRHRSRAGS